MPIPWVAAIAIGAAMKGVKSGLNARRDNRLARETYSEAQEIFEKAQLSLEKARTKTAKSLSDLGHMKVDIWDRQLGRFVRVFSHIKNVELTGYSAAEGFTDVNLTKDELRQMQEMSLKASEIVMGGVAALGTGALVGIAAYGGTMMFATASTSTAISALSGAAAYNATLAWLGGGSLAAGGLGMAGGVAVLGGLVAGPVLAVGGMILAAKARENLVVAKTNLAEAKKAAKEMVVARKVLSGIRRVTSMVSDVLSRLDTRMTSALNRLELLVSTSGPDYSTYREGERHLVYQAVAYARAMKSILETPILAPDGGLSQDCESTVTEWSNKLLLGPGEEQLA